MHLSQEGKHLSVLRGDIVKRFICSRKSCGRKTENLLPNLYLNICRRPSKVLHILQIVQISKHSMPERFV